MLTWRINALLAVILFTGVALARAETYFVADENTDDTYGVAALFATQPRLQTPAESPSPTRSARSSQRSSYVRLARAPNMFGDSFNNLGEATITTGGRTFVSDLPQAGGRIAKIGENGSPLPTDRVFFAYNGFQNAVSFGERVGGVLTRSEVNLNRYTVGFEKTFHDGWSSLDVRMLLTDGFGFDLNDATLDSGNVGNLAAFYKRLIYQDEICGASCGVGLGAPTGSDITGEFVGAPLIVRNQAFHLFPYFGIQFAPGDCWATGFVQLDFATNGNEVQFGTSGDRAIFNEQNLILADLSLGRWLRRDDSADYFRGVAAVFELHYASTLTDTDRADAISTQPGAAGRALLRNPDNRFDVLNATLGLHFQLTALSDLRFACVAPLGIDGNRQFDSELQASFNRYF